MHTRSAVVLFVLAAALPAPVLAQHGSSSGFAPQLAPASGEGQDAMAGFALAEGLAVELVASEPGLANPVAFTIDDRGRLFVAETFRLHKGVTDNRQHVYWIDEDLAARTVADRVAMQSRHQADELEEFARHHERIRVLLDTDGDRVFDTSKVFADGWNDLADGIAAGVLVVGGDVFYTNIPSLWRLRDTDGDDIADERDSLQTGYGVHVSLLGHDMHGLVVGPDRRLYFSIGDRGLTVEQDGTRFDLPHEGAVLRCELDGSHLEVVHRGLRNPQELAFDGRGNLFSGDNNSDSGDKARWVYIVDGGTSGWCIGYQYLNDRGQWNRERLWWPRFSGQPAWIVPPIANIASGPSGLAYYPGTGLPARYENTFFLCDFRGAPGPSGVWNLGFESAGAGFELARQEKFIWNTLPTDVGFGPEGGLYLADWVTGWGQTGKGRVYRIHDPAARNDVRVREVKRLLAQGLGMRPLPQLEGFLDHPDQRIRQLAQFELVDRGDQGVTVLNGVAHSQGSLRARLHGIWGVGIAARRTPERFSSIADLLDDGSAEVRAQTAKVLGDAGDAGRRFAGALRQRLADPNSRVRFFAAEALGRIGDGDALGPLVDMLVENGDHDAYLRHAGATALARIAAPERLRELATHREPAARLAAVLALRKLGHPAAGAFLADGSAAIRLEAARAIYDFDGIPEAMPQLANATGAADDLRPWQRDALALRILSAKRWQHRDEDAAALLAYAASTAPAALRTRALEFLAEWQQPSGRDPVVGNWRPVGGTELEPSGLPGTLPTFEAPPQIGAGLAAIVDSGEQPETIRRAAVEALAALGITAHANLLQSLTLGQGPVGLRVAAIEALDTMGAGNLRPTLAAIDAKAPVALRSTAVRLLGKLDPEEAMGMLGSIIDNGSMAERQNAIRTLADIRSEPAHELVARLLGDLSADRAPAALHLEILEAADKHKGAAGVAEALDRRPSAEVGTVEAYLECLEGGDPRRGERVFRNHQTATCLRCHALGGTGGDAGPALDGVGTRHDRRALLESLIEPAAQLADGFGSIVFRTRDGTLVQGLVLEETAEVVRVKDADGVVHALIPGTIESRSEPTTSMPSMAAILNRRQIRDVVEFLAGRR